MHFGRRIKRSPKEDAEDIERKNKSGTVGSTSDLTIILTQISKFGFYYKKKEK